MFFTSTTRIRCSVAFAAGLLSLAMVACGGGSTNSVPAPAASPSLVSSPASLNFANFASAPQTVTLSGGSLSGVSATTTSCKNIVAITQKGTDLPVTYTITPVGPGSCSLVFSAGALTESTTITVQGSAFQEVSFTQTSSLYASSVPLTYSVTNPNPIAVNVFYYLYACSDIPTAQSVCNDPGVANSGYLTGWTGFITLAPNQTVQNVISLMPAVGYVAAASVFYQSEETSSPYTKASPPPFATP